MRSTPFLPTLICLVALLAVVPFVHADVANVHRRTLQLSHLRHLRFQGRAITDLPSGWAADGCYTDNVAARTLTSAGYTDTTNMTVENCVNFCNKQNYIYAGVEYGQECYCGNVISNGGTTASDSDCSFPCTGNANEICGAGSRLNLYKSSAMPPPPPIIAPNYGPWVSLGCYSDNTATRTLTVGTAVHGGVSNNSVQSCADACFSSGYPLAGVEYSQECYCGSGFSNGGAPTPAGDCSMVCSGNSSEFCGGPDRLNVYNYTGTNLPTTTNPGGGGGGGGGGSSVLPVLANLPSGWSYNACWVDNANGRVLQTELPDNQALTVENCIASCSAQGFTLAGLEFSVQCFCGNNLVNGAVIAPQGDCNMACSGSSTEACGGPNRLSVYTSTGSVTALGPPTVQTTNLPGNWQYSRCLAYV